MSKVVIDVTINYDGETEQEKFSSQNIMIGTGEQSQLQLDAKGVSGVHALVKYAKGAMTIQDLGSTNGTMVDGEKITTETTITEDSEIAIGKATLTFKVASDATMVVRSRKGTENVADDETRKTVEMDEDELPEIEDEPQETSRITLELADVERDSFGIPTFVFKDELKVGERPRPEKRVLEVVLLWREAIMTVGHYAKPRRITVGDSVKNDFRIAAEHLPADRFPLLEPDGYGFICNVTDDVALKVKGEDGNILDLRQLQEQGSVAKDLSGPKPVYKYRIGLRDRIAVQFGELTFVVQYVSPARWIRTGITKTLDFYFGKIVAISLLAHLFIILAMLLTPQMPQGLEDQLFQDPNRFANLILNPPKLKKANKKFELDKKIKKVKMTESITKDFGKVEKKTVVLADKKGPKLDIDKREQDRKRALNSGIFSALKGSKGSAASVFSAGGLGTGINNAVNELSNQAVDDAGGVGGMGSRGMGGAFGGGGLGIGGLGSGKGGGGVGGNVGLAGRGKKGYSVIPGTTEVRGGLSKSQVAKVLHRAHNQVRYCYEKELNRNPNLYGKVVTNFTIGPTGRVVKTRVANSTMNDKNVEQCILRVINRLVFPNPKGGGVVDVNYPWIFKRSG